MAKQYEACIVYKLPKKENLHDWMDRLMELCSCNSPGYRCDSMAAGYCCDSTAGGKMGEELSFAKVGIRAASLQEAGTAFLNEVRAIIPEYFKEISFEVKKS